MNVFRIESDRARLEQISFKQAPATNWGSVAALWSSRLLWLGALGCVCSAGRIAHERIMEERERGAGPRGHHG